MKNQFAYNQVYSIEYLPEGYIDFDTRHLSIACTGKPGIFYIAGPIIKNTVFTRLITSKVFLDPSQMRYLIIR
jgi:hypothetical protein